ncbi:MAG TPA: hypothetical protein VMT37_02480 [Solirubrobacterales bacterium]|nr:hypothetical protein [Solirubrobacterales bacterium]
MRSWLAAAVAVAIGALGLLGAASASAATEFGDTCIGNGAAPGNYTLTTESDPSSALPITAPVSGIVTQLKVNIDSSFSPPPVPSWIKVLHPTGTPGSFQVTGEAQMTLRSGTLNTANVRMPIQAGDQLGLYGAVVEFAPGESGPISFLCGSDHAPGAEILAHGGDLLLGETGSFFAAAPEAVPVVARIEPDADGDGYGDETQDKCAQAATLQTACGSVVVSLLSQAGTSGVTVLVTTDTSAPVSVKGVVKLGKGKKAKLSGGSHTVSPGQIASFKLKFPGKLKAKLKELPPSKTLSLKLAVGATNVLGTVNTTTKTIKLKGQA